MVALGAAGLHPDLGRAVDEGVDVDDVAALLARQLFDLDRDAAVDALDVRAGLAEEARAAAHVLRQQHVAAPRAEQQHHGASRAVSVAECRPGKIECAGAARGGSSLNCLWGCL
eukprot:SAG31_NODE_1756_length_7343_cov_2.790309_2_plen_114_part_00